MGGIIRDTTHIQRNNHRHMDEPHLINPTQVLSAQASSPRVALPELQCPVHTRILLYRLPMRLANRTGLLNYRTTIKEASVLPVPLARTGSTSPSRRTTEL